ncbi:hypothetical protein [Morganella morganii]|uniref:hypothetical protein n=1 Tax=Morganella morganii TaxID=582 RepID=UPI0037525D23
MNNLATYEKITQKLNSDSEPILSILDAVDIKAVISILMYESIYRGGLPIFHERIIGKISGVKKIEGRVPTANDLDDIKRALGEEELGIKLNSLTSSHESDINKGFNVESLYSQNKNFIRGEYYLEHAEDYFSSLFNPFEKELIDKVGYSYEDAKKLFHTVNKLYLDNIDNAIKSSISKRDELIKLYKEDKSKFSSLLGRKFKNKNDAYKYIVFYINNEFISKAKDIFFISKADILKLSGTGTLALETLLDELTLEDNFTFDNERTYNVFSKKPFVKIEDEYLCAHLDMIYKSFYLLIDEFLKNDKELSKKYNKHKAANLEKKAIDLINKVLSDSEVYHEVYYNSIDSGLQCEVDGLLKYRNTLFIIEAKSHKVSEQAVDGSIVRIKKHVDQIIKDAYEQCIRAKRSLFTENHDPELRYKNKKKINLDLSDVNNVILMPLSQERFDEFTSNPHFFSESGIFDNNELPWAINIFDLYVVIDILDNPIDFIDYIQRRVSYSGRSSVYIHDELDWLGYYVFDRLMGVRDNIDNTEYLMVMIEPNSIKFDDYYIKGKDKPRLYSNDFINKIINEHLKYDFGYEAVKGFCFFDKKGMDELSKTILSKEKYYRVNGKTGTIISVNAEQRVINLFCFYSPYELDQDDFFNNRVCSALDKLPVQRGDYSGYKVYLSKLPINSDFKVTGVDFIVEL